MALGMGCLYKEVLENALKREAKFFNLEINFNYIKLS